jgi:hypothetical protein
MYMYMYSSIRAARLDEFFASSRVIGESVRKKLLCRPKPMAYRFVAPLLPSASHERRKHRPGL